ncbi:MAG TPA: hypothetical protein DEP42_01795 [Ruminococcaceae bacterium]|nr:hypothetical protein [Oscillospiraceae bacterium]
MEVFSKIYLEEVNRQATENPRKFFRACNTSYERSLKQIVKRVLDEKKQFILLTGPSASGKTTTSLKLKQEFLAHGVHAVAISLDDFFKDREKVAILPNGKPDFESPNSLDLARFSDVAKNLLENGFASYHPFDFKKEKGSEKIRRLQFPQGSVAIVEGLHALNPVVFSDLPEDSIFRLFVSVGSAFVNKNEEVVLSPRDVRLVRRILRDYRFRASDASNTLSLWPGVCQGEEQYIYPFKPFADAMLDTVFACEPCQFANMTLLNFTRAAQNGPLPAEAERLSKSLHLFEHMSQRIIPPSCVLREFLGGSLYLNKRTLSRRRRAVKPNMDKPKR